MASPAATPDGKPTKKESLRSRFSFHKMFYVVNGIELLERAAYYGFAAVSTIFLRQTFVLQGMGLAAATSLAATIGAIIFLLLYTVPVIGAPFTEKFGYRSSLGLVFAMLTTGYLLTFLAQATIGPAPAGAPVDAWHVLGRSWLVVACIFFIGVGAGIFKPIPAAVVSQTSDDTRRSLAFSIYYACINIGALGANLGLGVVGLLLGLGQGDPVLLRITFATSAVLVALALVVSFTLFRNMREPQKDKSIGQSVKVLGEIRHHPKFLVLMLIYSGFWFMYGLILAFLPAYMDDFHRLPSWFNEQLLNAINPLVIIIGAPLLAPLSTRIKALNLMIIGILVYAAGLLLIGFTGTSFFFLGGIVAYSAGELLTHPAYLSYVSKIAPADKVTTFLGYGFIPIGVGQFLGAKVGGDLYAAIGIRAGRPDLYWAIIASVGLLTAAALLVYNFVISGPRPAQPEAEPRPRRRFPVAPLAALVILLAIPALVFAGSAMPVQKSDGAAPAGDALNAASLVTKELPAITPKTPTKAGSEETVNVTLPQGATGTAHFVLTWSDEPDASGAQNQPDTFEVHVVAPNGTMVAMSKPTANPQGGKGTIDVSVPDAGPGVYQVIVKLDTAGPQQVNAGPAGPLPVQPPAGTPASPPPDDSNMWSLASSYQASA